MNGERRGEERSWEGLRGGVRMGKRWAAMFTGDSSTLGTKLSSKK